MISTIPLLILSNMDTIIGLLLAFHATAIAIVNLTPTPADDVFVGRLYKGIEIAAGIFGVKAKEFPNSAEMKAKVASKSVDMSEVDAWLNRK